MLFYMDVVLCNSEETSSLASFAFTLQESQVSPIKYISVEEYKNLLANEDPHYGSYNVDGPYGKLFDIITKRYRENAKRKSLLLQQKLAHYAPISLTAELNSMTADRSVRGGQGSCGLTHSSRCE